MELTPERQQRLLEAYATYSYPELAQAMIDADEAYAEAKAESNFREAILRFIKQRIIPARMDQDQISNITVKLANGEKRQLLVVPQVSVKTPPENRRALQEWLEAHDAGDIVSTTVNSSTLAAYVRRQMEAGEPYPHGICEINLYDTASLRKA